MSNKSDIAVRLGLRVRERRLALKLSQEAFAAKCGLDRTYISGIERGMRNVALRNIERITGKGCIKMERNWIYRDAD